VTSLRWVLGLVVGIKEEFEVFSVQFSVQKKLAGGRVWRSLAVCLTGGFVMLRGVHNFEFFALNYREGGRTSAVQP